MNIPLKKNSLSINKPTIADGLGISQSDIDFLWTQLRLPNNLPPNTLSFLGVRDVRGVANNVSYPLWAVVDQPFLRALSAVFTTTPTDANATSGTFSFGQTGNVVYNYVPTSYAIRGINLVDSSPRTISNLVASSAGLTQFQQQDDPSATPNGRVSPLTGPSNPLVYSGWMTLFGQFFDHGLDFIHKGGSEGYVMIPLLPDDPLYIPPTLADGSSNPAYIPGLSNYMLMGRSVTTTDPILTITEDVNGIVTLTTSPTGHVYHSGDLISIQSHSHPELVGAYTVTYATPGSGTTPETISFDITKGQLGSYTTPQAFSITTDVGGVIHDPTTSNNNVSPMIDQSQTYGSTASSTVFVREYNALGQTTGRLVTNDNPGQSGLATWALFKSNALNIGIKLHDKDVLAIPTVNLAPNGSALLVKDSSGFNASAFLIATDANGKKYYVKDTDLGSHISVYTIDAGNTVTSNFASGGVLASSTITLASIPAGFSVGETIAGIGIAGNTIITAISGNTITLSNALTAQAAGIYTATTFHYTLSGTTGSSSSSSIDSSTLTLSTEGHAFIDDRSFALGNVLTGHDAISGAPLVNNFGQPLLNGSGYSITYDLHGDLLDPLLAQELSGYYVSGDSRTNENIGLTAVHDVFHSEHDLVLQQIQALVQSRGAAYASQWTGEDYFQATKVVMEMEYQHLVFAEYARKLTPHIPLFLGYDPTVNAGITSEFANAVYRLGHSMLTETIDLGTFDSKTGLPTGNISSFNLYDAFTNPAMYASQGASAAGEVAIGMSRQVGNAIDQWITDTLQNKLFGQPLDLATLNITRGRDTGLPSLNAARAEFYAQTGDASLKPYDSWADFGAHLLHPETVIDFIEAYSGLTVLTTYGLTTYGGNHDSTYWANLELTDPAAYKDALNAAAQAAILDPTFYNVDPIHGLNDQGFQNVDLWIGGLAEMKVDAGMLGSTFDFVFATQMNSLQNGDRFYYLYRLVGTNLVDQMQNQLFSDIVMRNTGTTHLYSDIFSVPDSYEEMSTKTFTSVYLDQATGKETLYQGATAMHVGDTFDANGNVVHSASSTNNTHPYFDNNGVLQNTGVKGYTDPLTKIHYDQFIPDFTDLNSAHAAGYYTDGTYYGNNGDYVDARGAASPNTVPSVNKGASSEMIGGTSGNDLINGANGNDTIWGDAGNDTIDGGGSNDFIHGGDGNDVIHDYSGDNTVSGDAGNDFIAMGNGVDQADGGTGNDTISGGLGIDNLIGGSGDDIIYGDAMGINGAPPLNNSADGADLISGGDGNDTLYGGGGGDAIDGGAGNDVFYGGSGANALTGMEGNDTFIMDAGDTGVNNAMDGGTGFDTVDYSALVLATRIGSTGISIDLTNSGVPVIQPVGAVLAPDTYLSIESVIGTQYDDTITGGIVPAASVQGASAGNDTLEGGAGADVILPGNLVLTVAGGNGVDFLSYYHSRGAVNINLGTGAASGGDATGDTIQGGTFSGIIGSSGNDTMAGNNVIASVFGASGNDTFEGGGGGDLFISGATVNGGLDVLSYTLDTRGVSVNLTTNRFSGGDATGDSIQGGVGTSTFHGIVGGIGNDTLTGSASATIGDTLSGGLGFNTLTGGGGNDTFIVTGNDTITDFNTGDTLKVAAGASAKATLISAITGANVSNLGATTFLTKNIALNLSGAAGPNGYTLQNIGTSPAMVMTGSQFNDTFIGGTGVDNFIGGGGIDTVDYTASRAAVSVNLNQSLTVGGQSGYGSATGQGQDWLYGIQQVIGSSYNDKFTSSGTAINYFTGGLGADTFIINSNAVISDLGLGGKDSIQVISGTATAFIASTGWVASNASSNAGTVTIFTNGYVVDASLVSGFGAFNITNQALATSLIGGAGNDTITAGAYGDTLKGGGGNDTFIVNSGTATINDFSAQDLLSVGNGATANITLSSNAAINNSSVAINNNGTVNITSHSSQGVYLNNTVGLGNYTITFDAGGYVTGSKFSDVITDLTSSGVASISTGGGNDTITGSDSITDYFTIDASPNGSIVNITNFGNGRGGDSLTIKDPNATVNLTLGNAASGQASTIQDSMGGAHINFVTHGQSFNLTNPNAFFTVSGDSHWLTAGSVIQNDRPTAVTLTGSSGDDTLISGGNDTLVGGSGNDTFIVSQGNVTITDFDQSGVDTLTIAAGATVTLKGTIPYWAFGTTITNAGTLNVITDHDVDLSAFSGTGLFNISTTKVDGSSLTGSIGNDTITGGLGNDILIGGGGNNRLTGGDGNDTFIVTGNDTITDLSAGDILIVDGGATVNAKIGGAGWTATSATHNSGTVNITTSGLLVNLAADTDPGGNGYTVTNTSATGTTLTGSAFNDTLIGSAAGADILNGGLGNDILNGGGGNDTLTGGAGNDTFTINAGTDTITDLGNGNDVLLVGRGAAANVTIGGAWTATSDTHNLGTVNITTSGFLVDLSEAGGPNGYSVTNTSATGTTLIGSAFNDILIGGAGNDSLTGGAGADAFVFNQLASPTSYTTITDFVSSTGDSLVFSQAVFTGISSADIGGALNTNEFISASGQKTATTNLQHFIYDTLTGALYYDADGSDNVFAPVQVALLGTPSSHPALVNTDIHVIA